ALTVGAPSLHPDVNVRHGQMPPTTEPAPPPVQPSTDEYTSWQPDTELAVLTLDPSTVVQVTNQGRLIAVAELISPRNKDRREARVTSQNLYLGYLMHGVLLLRVDVHPQPVGFSFADSLAAALGISPPPCPPPLAISYRVGGSAINGGRLLGIW